MTSSLKRGFFVVSGTGFLVLGIIGAFLPLLPTTPFLLLAAFCFDRGSPKFHTWLLQHRIFGPPIRDWQANHVIRVRYKVLATTMLLVSAFILLPRPTVPPWGKFVYTVFITLVALFIWTRKSK